LLRAFRNKSRGVFSTPLGEDNINGIGKTLGLRVRGLPPGKYRIYLIGWGTLDHHSWGNYLELKAFRNAIGINLSELPETKTLITPLDDPNAADWVEGQTHSVGIVQVESLEDYVTLLSRKDRDASPKPQGGRSVIVGFQIVQIPAAND
jgi:hypothetical protein